MTKRLVTSRRATIGNCVLPRTAFEQISQGSVDDSVISLLRKGQYSLRKLVLRALVDAVKGRNDDLGRFSNLDQVWSVLASAEQADPSALQDVMMNPAVGVLLVRAFRAATGVGDPSTTWEEVGGLHTVAASAAMRCGIETSLPVPVVHGTVALPTVGWFRLPTAFPVGNAEFHNTEQGMRLTAFGGSLELRPDASDGHFHPVKRHRTAAHGQTLDVVIDDFSPHREFSSSTPPTPLSDAEHEQWAKMLDESWELLTRWHRRRATEIAACLSTVVPLPRERGVFASSSSAAFGAIAMSPKNSSSELAEALVHELQHSKLNATLDLVDLHRSADLGWYYAPWRDDPRTIDAMLHGIYAFVSVVEFWSAQRDLLSDGTPIAVDLAFAHRARQVARALAMMRGSHELTDIGREFVAATSVRLAECASAAVPPAVRAAVDVLTADHYATWRSRHVRPSSARVERLADRWGDGSIAVPAHHEGDVVPGRETGESLRSVLVRTRLLDRHGFERLTRRADPDAAFARGDLSTAANGYAKRIRETPRGGGDWVGLGLALDSPTLLGAPELVRAVYLEVVARTGRPPDPIELAAWMDETAS